MIDDTIRNKPNTTDICQEIGAGYNRACYFVTPDRRCEQFLYQRSFSYINMIKGETGWTYWVYERDILLQDAIHDYKEYLAYRRKMDSLWRGDKKGEV